MSKTHVWSLVDLRPLAEKIHDSLDRSFWRVSDLLISLQEKKIGPFKTEISLINFLKRRPKIFGVDSKYVWSMVSGYHNSLILEKKILALIDKKIWKITDLEKALFEKNVKTFKPEGSLTNFLKKRPEIFCVTSCNTHVWNKEFDKICLEEQKKKRVQIQNSINKDLKNSQSIKLKEKKTGSNLYYFILKEKIISMLNCPLQESHVSDVWKIATLEKRLIEKGIKHFKSKDTLANWLKNRPKLFCTTETCVWSREVQEAYEKTMKSNEKANKRVHKHILKIIEKNPGLRDNNLFQRLPEWCKQKIHSVNGLCKFLKKYENFGILMIHITLPIS